MAAAVYQYDPLSPIHWVGPNANGSGKVYVKTPASYEYNLQDVSKSTAGRTEDALMHKQRLGQVCSLNLTWNAVKTEDVAALLQMFDDEYFYVEYLDAKTGEYRVDKFYCGDRATPMYNAVLGLWSNISFNLIRQKGGDLI